MKSEMDGQDEYVIDPARRKSVKAGPEESVRQAIISFLTTSLGIPLGLISVEKEVSSSTEMLRTDLVVYTKQGAPWMLVECKAPGVKIAQHVFDQVARYNTHLKAPYLLVSNGTEHYAWSWNGETNTIEFLTDLPRYPSK